MRSLNCGDISFKPTEKTINNVKDRINKPMRDFIIYEILQLNPEERDKANKLTAFLCFSDEWPDKINNADCDRLFFILCNNVSKERTFKITTFTQGRLLFEETENDYRKLKDVTLGQDINYEIGDIKGIPYLYDGTIVRFKVPVGHYEMHEKKYKVFATKKAKPYLVLDNDDSIQISWGIISDFLQRQKNNPNKLLSCLEQNSIIEKAMKKNIYENKDTFYEMLKYCGFYRDREKDFDEMNKNLKLVFSENKLMAVGSKMDINGWKNGILMPMIPYFVIETGNGSYEIIEKKR